MQLSNQQQAIINAVASTSYDHIRVEARAGCGKTTTILSALPVAKGRVAFVAFNKAIAEELRTKAPASVDVMTLHQVGMRLIGSALGMRLTIEQYKVSDILRDLRARREDVAGLARLVGLCKNLLLTGTDEDIGDLSVQYDIDVPAAYWPLVRQALQVSTEQAKRSGLIDFDDMVYLPSVLDAKGASYAWVFVDEAQDVNAAQVDLILRISRGGRVCFVGDPHQAIYGFRGADMAAMDTLQAALTSRGPGLVQTLNLTITRRCPKVIVAAAQELVADFEAHPDAPNGTLRVSTTCDPTTGDMVLSRVNAPLIPMAYNLVRSGIPVKVQGRDIGAGLTKLLDTMNATSIDDLHTRLTAYQTREETKLNKKFADSPYKLEAPLVALQDRVGTLRELATCQTSIAGIRDAITSLFSDVKSSHGVVLLSSIHKAKGLEATRVWYLQGKAFNGPQEANLRYVAITRAKSELVLVQPQEHA